MAFSDDFIDRLRQGNQIESLFASYVNLTRRGRDYLCLCPFHSEKTPSCHVDVAKQLFHCFGCHAGGDIITFIMKIENLEYIEAVKFLAQRAGIEMPDDKNERNSSRLKARILEINRETANYYYRMLSSREGAAGLNYIKARGLSPQTIKKYGIGFAPESWDNLQSHLASLGFTENEMIAACVCRQNEKGHTYDFFRNRIIFPIIDLRGNVIAFGGRIIEDKQPKYLNSSDTLVFKKSRNLFSLNFAKNSSSNRLILAEGYMDVVSVNQAGFENVVATLGTALTPEQARKISQYAKEAIIAYDSDEAGQNATHRAINLLGEAGVNAKILKIDGAKDPDEYIKKYGSERFRLLLNNSGDAIPFELDKCREGLDIQTDSGKAECLKRMVKVLADISNPLDREVYTSRVSKEFEFNLEALRLQVGSLAKKKLNIERIKERKNIISTINPRDELNPEAQKNFRESKAEEGILAFLLKNNDKLEFLEQNLSDELFVTSLNQRFYQIIAKKIKNCTNFSFSMLSDEFTPDEMGRITGIDMKYEEIIFTEKYVNECIEILKDYHKRKVLFSGSELSDDDLIRLQQEKYKGKK